MFLRQSPTRRLSQCTVRGARKRRARLAVVALFRAPERYRGQFVPVYDELLTPDEMVGTFTRVTGIRARCAATGRVPSAALANMAGFCGAPDRRYLRHLARMLSPQLSFVVVDLVRLRAWVSAPPPMAHSNCADAAFASIPTPKHESLLIFMTGCHAACRRFVRSTREEWFKRLSRLPSPTVEALMDVYQYQEEYMCGLPRFIVLIEATGCDPTQKALIRPHAITNCTRSCRRHLLSPGTPSNALVAQWNFIGWPRGALCECLQLHHDASKLRSAIAGEPSLYNATLAQRFSRRFLQVLCARARHEAGQGAVRGAFHVRQLPANVWVHRDTGPRSRQTQAGCMIECAILQLSAALDSALSAKAGRIRSAKRRKHDAKTAVQDVGSLCTCHSCVVIC